MRNKRKGGGEGKATLQTNARTHKHRQRLAQTRAARWQAKSGTLLPQCRPTRPSNFFLLLEEKKKKDKIFILTFFFFSSSSSSSLFLILLPFCPRHLRLARDSATGTRTRVARVRAEYPNQLDYSGVCFDMELLGWPLFCVLPSSPPSSSPSCFPAPP